MSSFDPDSTWASPRPSLRFLFPVLLAAFALAFVLTPAAGAQEADPAGAGEVVVPSTDPPPAPEPPPPPPEVVLPPEPAPPPDPAPTPEPSPVPEPGPMAVDPHQQLPERDTAAHAGPASFEPVATTFTPAAPAPATPTESSDRVGPTTAPLGWDVYDDVLLAETYDGGSGGAGSLGARAPAVFRGLGALGTIASPVKRDRRQDTNPPSRAEPISGGGSDPGGPGPGQGPSLGLFGAAGGSSAGMALLTLLGIACGWLLLAPLPKRAFLTSTAMWRLSAYVPPIDHPG